MSLRRIRIQAFAIVLLAIVALLPVRSFASEAGSQKNVAPRVPEAVTDGTAKLASHAAAGQQYELAIALPVRNESALDQKLVDLQDHKSAGFHKYLTVDQFADQFAPSKADYAKVVEYIQSKGFHVTVQHANRLVVSFTGTTAQIERAFHVTMNNYQHPTEARTFYAPDREPTFPGLKVPVLLIAGLDNYVLPHSMLKNRGQMAHATPVRQQAISHTNPPVSCYGPPYSVNVGDGACNSYTPTDMRAAYYGGTALTGAGQQIGILGFGGFFPDDLAGFAAVDNATAPTVTFLAGSACAASCSDGEQMLDVLWASGMAPGAAINFFTNRSNDLTIINAMASSNVSSVYSSSWGWGKGNAAAEDTDFQEMQAQGQTFVNATGDDGGYNSSVWYYPGGNPYITEVGGTQVVTNGKGGSWSSELAWPGSSGGVPPASGKVYPIPAWQAPAANANNGISTVSRSDPDISGEADYEMLGCSGNKQNGNSCEDTYGGTSYATPTWAGFFALLNQASVAAGNGTLGFANEEVYEAGLNSTFSANFHDVTVCGGIDGPGPGPACNSSDEGTPVTGFNPVAGFDDVTGWGSPNGLGLIDALSIPTLAISGGTNGFYTPTSNITFTANFPEFSGTVTFTATANSATTTIGTCTLSSGTCSKTVAGSAVGLGTYSVQAVYQETTTSTKKYSAAHNLTVAYLLTFTSVSHNFGQVAVGTAATAYGLTLTNTSTAAYPYSLNFTPAHGFTVATSCPAMIAAGAHCQLQFNFTPTATGAVSAAWSLVAETNFQYSVSNGGLLQGSGTSQGGVSVTTAGHNFGSLATGATSPTYGVELSNSTTSAVTLTKGSVTAPFTSVTNCGATLAAGSSCELEFTFKPTAVGTVHQVYALSSNVTITAQGNPLPNGGITLTGTGH